MTRRLRAKPSRISVPMVESRAWVSSLTGPPYSSDDSPSAPGPSEPEIRGPFGPRSLRSVAPLGRSFRDRGLPLERFARRPAIFFGANGEAELRGEGAHAGSTRD